MMHHQQGLPGSQQDRTNRGDTPDNKAASGKKTVSAHASRKGLKDPERLEKTLQGRIPEGWMPGQAHDFGDCFFDALAQWMNKINHTDINTDKYLRRLCHDFYLKNKAMVDKWNASDFGGMDGGDQYHMVQYTAAECEEHFNGAAPVWGRSWVEGRILCHQLNLAGICVIEILEDPDTKEPIASFHLATGDDYSAMGEDDAREWMKRGIPVLVVEQGSLHFVPLLANEGKNQELSASKSGKDDSKLNKKIHKSYPGKSNRCVYKSK